MRKNIFKLLDKCAGISKIIIFYSPKILAISPQQMAAYMVVGTPSVHKALTLAYTSNKIVQ